MIKNSTTIKDAFEATKDKIEAFDQVYEKVLKTKREIRKRRS